MLPTPVREIKIKKYKLRLLQYYHTCPNITLIATLIDYVIWPSSGWTLPECAGLKKYKNMSMYLFIL